ncbi:hypothetical protein ACJMK2_020984 [Sinanodonta woodiana]|uniref:CWH43-like N-terminal domain-containing protein n=1 Tax=Sinanodonta woodiana TaxID=1069815 RepID=A0ABD3U280_SINWO
MCRRGFQWLPISVVVLSVATFVCTYIIAVVRGDVSAIFPYISDTGTEIPESCVFGQFLNMAAILALGTMYVRYKLVQTLGGHEDSRLRCLNKAGLVMGVLSAFGLTLVANFQETSLEPVHVTGAALVFGVGVLYEFVQTALSFHMCPNFNGKLICRVRLAISIISFIAMIIAFSAAGVSHYENQSVAGNKTERLHWRPEDKGFTAHIISTVGEWFAAIAFLTFFFTYIRDFQKIDFELRSSMRVRHLDEEPVYASESTWLLI